MSLRPATADERAAVNRAVARLRSTILALAFGFAQGGDTDAPLYRLPALTPIDLVMEQAVSSNEQVNGDRFPLRVAEDVVVDGVVLIPAGSRGEGEVVHAARSRAGGKAGELILAARYVKVGGVEIKLRSFAGGSGKDRTKAAVGIAATLGFPALLVRGGAYVIPEGMLANAKTAEDLDLPAVEAGLAEPASAPDASVIPPTEEP